MGMAVAAADRVKAEFGATGLLVHHTGKSGELERGSSSLRGAADAMLAVEKDGDRVTLTSAAQKDAADFPPIVMRLRPWTVAEGRSTCVLERMDGDSGGPLTGSARVALTALAEVFGEDGATFTEWLHNARVPETTLRRVIKDVLGPQSFIDPASPPKARGGKYRVTASGREALYGVTATPPGGDSGPQDQGLFAHRHSPPPDRHGGNRHSPPPQRHPLRGGGDGGDGDRGGPAVTPNRCSEEDPEPFQEGPAAPAHPCQVCKQSAWWQQPSGAWVCGVCHPQPRRAERADGD
jgi:hypothetical protein